VEPPFAPFDVVDLVYRRHVPPPPLGQTQRRRSFVGIGRRGPERRRGVV
jgi:hypothetical protein